jgi:nuclear GTP-binding protein
MTQDELSTSKCFGANTLIALLKNYCRSKDLKTAISVGVIGFPNVGKSSIINSLKRSRAVNVGPVAGVTKTAQVRGCC